MTDAEWRAAQEEWNDAANWRWGLIYVAARDPRIWVRKRQMQFGWTFNFAHPVSWFLCAGFTSLLLGLPVLWRWLS